MIASLNSFFTFAGCEHLKIKTIKEQRQIFCSEDKELTKEEYTRLLNAAERNGNKRLNLILQTVCGTGIRVSELKFITVESVKKGESFVFCKGKRRSVFIVKALQKKLLKYAAEQKIESGCIFITRTGKPVSRTNIWRDMKKLCKEANVNPNRCSPTTFATCLQECSMASKRILPNLLTFSVTAVSIQHEFILSQQVQNTVSVWKI